MRKYIQLDHKYLHLMADNILFSNYANTYRMKIDEQIYMARPFLITPVENCIREELKNYGN